MKTEELFGKDGISGTLGTAMGEITKEFGTGNGTFAAKIAEAITTLPQADFNFSTEYGKFKGAVDKSIQLIDEALETNDLTELDTTNLKALRSYLTETLATVDTAIKDSGLKSDADNKQADVTKEKLEKIKAGLDSATELGKMATEKATATHTFSQQQPETVADMRNQLQAFAANPKAADGTGDTIKTQLDEITKALTNATDGIQKLVNDAATAQGNLNIKDKYTALKTAVKAATDAIDEKLDSGDLTQLDTSNLKALKSSINDIQSQLENAFTDLGLKFDDANNAVPVDTAKKLKESLESGVFKSNIELGEKARSWLWRNYWGKMELLAQ